jgi:hypothetical protein
MKRHTFRGTRYRVNVDEKVEGYAEERDKQAGQLEIYVDPTLSPRRFLNRAIHEALHKIRPEMSEGKVEGTADALEWWLWRLGYRRTKC